jgi:hypothetical protein
MVVTYTVSYFAKELQFLNSFCFLAARRAYDLLEVENPAALNFANAALAPLKRHYPSITESEGNYPFVECATFADVIKGKGYSW